MGGKSQSAPSISTIPDAPEMDMEAILGPMMEMMGQSTMMTQQMVADNNARQAAMTVPEPTDLTSIDWDKENAALQAKIDTQISEEDTKRKGVLGTILTNIDDDDDPLTVGSLLTGDDA